MFDQADLVSDEKLCFQLKIQIFKALVIQHLDLRVSYNEAIA